MPHTSRPQTSPPHTSSTVIRNLPTADPGTQTLAMRTLATPIGELLLVASPVGLRAVLWPGESHDLTAAQIDLTAAQEDRQAAQRHLTAAADQLAEYFAGDRQVFDLALDLVGTSFQQHVWSGLRSIPFGRTTSYGKLAAGVGGPNKARAVGAACGRNPISIVVPCHRVVSASGQLTGFAGGLDVKAWLLAHEQQVLGPSAGG